MKKYIRLKTEEQFKELDLNKWKEQGWMWNAFKENTCYILEEKCLISLDKAIELGYSESE